MRYRVKVHDENKVGPLHNGDMAWAFDTQAEAQAFYEGVSWVNDSALTIEHPEPIPEPEVTAHCDTCGVETTATDLPRPGSPCGRPVPVPYSGGKVVVCDGTYVEGPPPIFTLTRLEEVDVTYDVKAPTLDEAFRRLENYDEDAIVDRFEDAAAWFEAGEVRYLGEDDDWHYAPSDWDEHDHTPPRLGGGEAS